MLLLCTPIIAIGQEQQSQYQTDANHGVKVRYELNSDDSYTFYGNNPFFIPYSIHLDFPLLENLNPSVPLPLDIVLQPGTVNQALLTLSPGNDSKLRFDSETTIVMGDVLNTKPDTSYGYIFPYAHGSKCEVGQGFNGTFSHSGQNQFAIDFSMDEGSQVFAARDGIVVETKSDSNRGGPSRQYEKDANYIIIMHGDGTFGNYVHLKKDGVLVNPGDRVVVGQLIGYSGNTGLSSGPHLHFDVRIPLRSGITQSIPIKFLNYDSTLIVPLANHYYYSTHPGMDPYQVVLGDLLTDKDFSSYFAQARKPGSLDVRSEQVDNSLVLFVSNGLSKEQTIDLELSLNNLNSSRGTRFKLIIPANTEIFASILRPINLDGSASYSVRYRYL